MNRILIIDDDATHRYFCKVCLANEHYNLEEFDDPSIAYQYIQENEISLILLDWKMPKMSGMEFLKQLKMDKANALIPVLVISGFNKEEVIPNSLQYELVDFISKPISKTELNAQVKKMLRISSNKQQLETAHSELDELYEKQNILRNEVAEKQVKIASLGIQNDQFFFDVKDLKQKIKEVKNLLPEGKIEAAKALNKIVQKLEKMANSKELVDQINLVYKTLEPEFVSRLNEIDTKLTPLDIKHCLYLRMNLLNNEIASIFNIDTKSVQMRAYRLRKKLNLKPKQDLRKFIASI